MHSFFSSGSDASIFATTLFEAISRNVFCTRNVAVTPRLTGLNSLDKADFLSVSKSSPAARNKSFARSRCIQAGTAGKLEFGPSVFRVKFSRAQLLITNSYGYEIGRASCRETAQCRGET